MALATIAAIFACTAGSITMVPPTGLPETYLVSLGTAASSVLIAQLDKNPNESLALLTRLDGYSDDLAAPDVAKLAEYLSTCLKLQGKTPQDWQRILSLGFLVLASRGGEAGLGHIAGWLSEARLRNVHFWSGSCASVSCMQRSLRDSALRSLGRSRSRKVLTILREEWSATPKNEKTERQGQFASVAWDYCYGYRSGNPFGSYIDWISCRAKTRWYGLPISAQD